MMKTLMLALATSWVLGAGVAAAATPEELCRDGQISMLRISKLKSPQARAQFDKAAKGQVSWYRSKGFSKNRVFVGSVLVQDPTTRTWSVSPSEAVTLHTDSPGPAAKRDAGYDAFVADFRASSDIATEKLVCLREPAK